MEINKYILFSLVLILGVAESFDYVDKELESEEGLQGMYDRWRTEHKVEKKSPDRYNVFTHNVQRVHASNKENKPYKLHLNHFADMTEHEIYNTYTSHRAHYLALMEPHNFTLKSAPPSGNAADLPKEIDWRNQNVITPVKNQGQCGSCWAFAAVAAVESVNAIRTGQLIRLSEQQLLDCDSNGRNNACNGGVACEAFQFIKDHGGLATEESYPYVGKREVCCQAKFGHHSVTIDGREMVKPPNDEVALMKAVVRQPVEIAMEVSGDFPLYKEGVFTGPCGINVNHAMLLVGYGETPEGVKYWIIKNSWGEEWGEKGYVRMARGLGDNNGLCGLYRWASIPLKSPETKNIELTTRKMVISKKFLTTDL